MRGEAERATGRLSAALDQRERGDALDDVSQPPRIDRVLIERLSIVRQLLDSQVRQRHLARRAHDLQPDVARIGSLRMARSRQRRSRSRTPERCCRPNAASRCGYARWHRRFPRKRSAPRAPRSSTPCCRSSLPGLAGPPNRLEIDGNAVRCRHATTRPLASSPAVSRLVLTVFTYRAARRLRA